MSLSMFHQTRILETDPVCGPIHVPLKRNSRSLLAHAIYASQSRKRRALARFFRWVAKRLCCSPLQSESNPQGDLVMANCSVLDVASRLHDFEPLHIANGF